jgi:hypothetical protein
MRTAHVIIASALTASNQSGMAFIVSSPLSVAVSSKPDVRQRARGKMLRGIVPARLAFAPDRVFEREEIV